MIGHWISLHTFRPPKFLLNSKCAFGPPWHTKGETSMPTVQFFGNINYCSNFFLSQWIIGSIRKAKISTGSLYFVTDQSGLIPNHLWIKPGQCSPVILIITYDKIIDKIRAIFFLKNSTRIFLSSALFWNSACPEKI